MSLGGSAKKESAKSSGEELITGTTTTAGTETTTGSRRGTEQLVLEQEAIDKIIEDVLSGPGGLAEIFAGEQTSGIFDSSVAAQASGDLTAKLVGEIAKLTGRTEKQEVFEAETDTLSTEIAEQLTKFKKKSKGKEFGAEASFEF